MQTKYKKEKTRTTSIVLSMKSEMTEKKRLRRMEKIK